MLLCTNQIFLGFKPLTSKKKFPPPHNTLFKVDIEWDAAAPPGLSWKKLAFDASGTSGAWSPSFINGSVPANFTYVSDTTFAFRSAHPFNFGHVFNDNLVATVAAANMFHVDLQTNPPPQILLLENQDETRKFVRRKKNGFKWLWGLTGRNPATSIELPDGAELASAIGLLQRF
jgi:hypothetical protein